MNRSVLFFYQTQHSKHSFLLGQSNLLGTLPAQSILLDAEGGVRMGVEDEE